jgi:hypothetical protein
MRQRLVKRNGTGSPSSTAWAAGVRPSSRADLALGLLARSRALLAVGTDTEPRNQEVIGQMERTWAFPICPRQARCHVVCQASEGSGRPRNADRLVTAAGRTRDFGDPTGTRFSSTADRTGRSMDSIVPLMSGRCQSSMPKQDSR